jgi:hypothetical protein
MKIHEGAVCTPVDFMGVWCSEIEIAQGLESMGFKGQIASVESGWDSSNGPHLVHLVQHPNGVLKQWLTFHFYEALPKEKRISCTLFEKEDDVEEEDITHMCRYTYGVDVLQS